MIKEEKSSKKKLWLIVVLVALLLIAGLATGLSLVFLNKVPTDDNSGVQEDQGQNTPFVPLEPSQQVTYKVTWKDGDEILKESEVAVGKLPVYGFGNPEKAADENGYYEFDEWDKPLEPVTGDVTYNAIFHTEPQKLDYQYKEELQGYEVEGFKDEYKQTRGDEALISKEYDDGTRKAPVVAIANRAFIFNKDSPGTINNFLKRTIIPSTVRIIGDSAYDRCKALTSLGWTGENTQVTKIGEDAFNGTSISGSVVLPDTIVELGKGAFSRCNKITSLSLPNHLPVIPNGCFIGVSMRSLVLPTDLQSIGFSAFQDCKNLEEIEIPSGVKMIDTAAFSGCKKLRKVTFAEESVLKNLGGNSFANCILLERIILPDSLFEIGSNAFENSGLKSVYLSSGITEIYPKAFASTQLKSLYIPAGIRNIETNAFNNIKTLKEIRCGEEKRPGTWSSKWIGDGTNISEDQVLWGQERPAEPYNALQTN